MIKDNILEHCCFVPCSSKVEFVNPYGVYACAYHKQVLDFYITHESHETEKVGLTK